MDDEMRKEALGEVLMDELNAIREYVQDIPAIKKKVDSIDVRLEVVETDVKAIKAVVTDHSKQLDNHEQRITTLETA